MFLCAAGGWRVGISEYAMYAQASGRLKAGAVCTILKALLAIRPDGWLHGSTICPRGKEQCGRSNLDLSGEGKRIFSLYWSGRAISGISGAKRICA